MFPSRMEKRSDAAGAHHFPAGEPEAGAASGFEGRKLFLISAVQKHVDKCSRKKEWENELRESA